MYTQQTLVKKTSITNHLNTSPRSTARMCALVWQTSPGTLLQPVTITMFNGKDMCSCVAHICWNPPAYHVLHHTPLHTSLFSAPLHASPFSVPSMPFHFLSPQCLSVFHPPLCLSIFRPIPCLCFPMPPPHSVPFCPLFPQGGHHTLPHTSQIVPEYVEKETLSNKWIIIFILCAYDFSWFLRFINLVHKVPEIYLEGPCFTVHWL